jgi:hypothetical protein
MGLIWGYFMFFKFFFLNEVIRGWTSPKVKTAQHGPQLVTFLMGRLYDSRTIDVAHNIHYTHEKPFGPMISNRKIYPKKKQRLLRQRSQTMRLLSPDIRRESASLESNIAISRQRSPSSSRFCPSPAKFKSFWGIEGNLSLATQNPQV